MRPHRVSRGVLIESGGDESFDEGPRVGSPIDIIASLPDDFDEHLKLSTFPSSDDINIDFMIRSAEEIARGIVIDGADTSKLVQLLILQKLWNNLHIDKAEFNRAFNYILSIGVCKPSSFFLVSWCSGRLRKCLAHSRYVFSPLLFSWKPISHLKHNAKLFDPQHFFGLNFVAPSSPSSFDWHSTVGHILSQQQAILQQPNSMIPKPVSNFLQRL
jgi:hypothetical protein